MKKLLSLFTIMFVCLSSVQAEDLKETYTTGFETTPVSEFKKNWEAKGNAPLKFPSNTGHAVVVSSIDELSPAAVAGLEINDIVRSINGKMLRRPDDAAEAFKTLNPRDEINLVVIRRGNKKLEFSTVVVKPITKLEYEMRVHCNRTTNANGITEVRHRHSTSDVFKPKNFQLYYTEKNGSPDKLFLRISHLDDDRLITKKFKVITKNNSYQIEKKRSEYERATELQNDLSEVNAIGHFWKLNPFLRSSLSRIDTKFKSGEELSRLDHNYLNRTGFDDLISRGATISESKKVGPPPKNKKADPDRPHVRILFRNIRIAEWYDAPLTKQQELMINDIATSNNVRLRYEGEKYYVDYDLPVEVRNRMATVLKLYKANGGLIAE